MIQEKPSVSPPRFAAGTRLGRCSVVAFLGREALGERYAVYYGTTNHVMDLFVPEAGAESPTLEDYKAYMARVAPVAKHPALAHCFSTGIDTYFSLPAAKSGEGDEGTVEKAVQIPWMRVEHVSGAPQWSLVTEMDDETLAATLPPPRPNEDATMRDMRENPDVPNLALFIAAARGNAVPGELARLVGDALGAMSALHIAHLSADEPTAADIALDRTPRSATPLARLFRYAQRKWETGTAAADLAAFASIVRQARVALPEDAPLSKVFDTFASKIEAGHFPTASEASVEYAALLAAAGISTTPGSVEEREAARNGRGRAERSRSRAFGGAEPSSRRHRRSKGGAPSLLSGESDAARQVRAFFGAGMFVALLAAIGVAVYVYMTWSDAKGRERYAQMFLADAPVVTVIPTEIDGEGKASGAAVAYGLSGPALASAVAVGEPFAVARDAVADIFKAAPESPSAETAARADAALAAILPELLDSPPDDIAAAFLRGFGALLALGRPYEPQVAWRELETAANANFPLAAVLYGDLVCGGPERSVPAGVSAKALSQPPFERDAIALEYYRKAADAVDAAPEIREAAKDRIVALLRRAPKLPGADFVAKWAPWLDNTADAGHIPAMAMLAVPGPFCTNGSVEALDWLRRISRSQASTPAVKAWAQVRMAARFARGVGTPPSESAARVWYERAAKLGNPKAMVRWAEYLESGKGDPNGLKNPDAAEEWYKKVESAEPEPDFEPAWWPVSPLRKAGSPR